MDENCGKMSTSKVLSTTHSPQNIPVFSHLCEICGYSTNNKSNYNKHLRSAKHINKTNPRKKTYVSYKCDVCDYNTDDKTKWNRHIKTKKHRERSNKPHAESTHTPSPSIQHPPSPTHEKDEDIQTVIEESEQEDEKPELDKSSEDINTKLDKFMDFTLTMFNTVMQSQQGLINSQEKQRKDDRELLREVLQKVGTTNTINNSGTFINNNVTVKLLNEQFSSAPSLVNYISQALSDQETISLIQDGKKFHEIFEHKVVTPMKGLNCSLRPLLLVKQKTKQRRQNLFVKTDDGWEDDSKDKDIFNSSIDNAACFLHKRFKDVFYNGGTDMSLEEYMDTVYNVREPLLTDKKTTSVQQVMKSVQDALEISKDDLVPG